MAKWDPEPQLWLTHAPGHGEDGLDSDPSSQGAMLSEEGKGEERMRKGVVASDTPSQPRRVWL